MADDLEEDIADPEDPEELDDDEIEVEDLDDDDEELEFAEDFEEEAIPEAEVADDDEEEEEAAPEKPAARRRRSDDDEGEEDEEDEDLHPDDVEADLDTILRDRLVVAEDEEDEEEEEVGAEPEERSDSKVRPRSPGEFVCQSCFLVKHPSQLADADRRLCRDCV